jgi:hypothetical protein
LDNNSLRLQFSPHEPEDSFNEIIDVNGCAFLAIVLEHRPDVADYPTSTMTVTDDTLQGRTRLIEVGRLVRKPTQAGTGICYHSPQRLVDLVSD